MNYKEERLQNNQQIVKVVNLVGDKEFFVGFYKPDEPIVITSRKKLVSYLILQKKYHLLQVLMGQEGKFYFVLVKNEQ